MPSPPKHRLFQRFDRIAEGWYWALPSAALAKGQAVPLKLQGKSLALFRGEDGKVVALDAFCPHLGAHLGHGKVEGNALRCALHKWKFDKDGRCVDVPCQQRPAAVATSAHPVEERFGFIWVHNAPPLRRPPPFVPELQNEDVAVGKPLPLRFRGHPHALVAHAVDAQAMHVNGQLSSEAELAVRGVDESCQLFSAASTPSNYALCVWNGATFSLSVGPKDRRQHLLVAGRLGEGGVTEAQVIPVAKRRQGLFGPLLTALHLLVTALFARRFLRRAASVLAHQRLSLRAPVRADRALLELVQHLDRQSLAQWGYGEVEAEPIQVEPAVKQVPRAPHPGLRN